MPPHSNAPHSNVPHSNDLHSNALHSNAPHSNALHPNALHSNRRLSQAEIAANVPAVLPGEWFGIEFPINFEMMQGAQFGAPFLTRAFHAAGALPPNNSVTRLLSLLELPLQGDDAQGGAGIKAIIRVEYARPDPTLHQTLFVKMPWLLGGEHDQWRALLSSAYGDGDGRELSTYVLLEDLLPVRIPKLYFADISRKSTNYILITECIPYGEADGLQGSASAGQILPKSGKYQDDRLPNAHEYYYALMKAFARVAAADKRGAFDSVVGPFEAGLGAAPLSRLQVQSGLRTEALPPPTKSPRGPPGTPRTPRYSQDPPRRAFAPMNHRDPPLQRIPSRTVAGERGAAKPAGATRLRQFRFAHPICNRHRAPTFSSSALRTGLPAADKGAVRGVRALL